MKMKLLSGIGVSFKAMAIVLGMTVFVVAAAHADEYKYSDSWGKAGYSVDAQSKSNLTVNYSIKKFGLNDFVVDGEPMLNIELPGNLLFNDEGAPNLPGSGRYVAIPQGATASFEITSMRTEVIKNVDIAPAPRIPWETETEPMDYSKDMSIYSVDAFYPASPVQISEVTEIRGVDAVMLGITPFQYNPVTKELIVYRDLKIEMTFEGGNGHFGEDRLRSRWFDPLLEDMLLNASSLPKVDYNKSFQGTDEAGCEYLIITPDGAEFQQWADSIKVFRTMQGISTDVVTISDVGGNNTNTIENYINDAYYTWDVVPTAVLLIGDYGNSGNTITSPIWDGYCVSDNIYADVTNNDMPDIVFARMTAQNESQLEVMITKFLDYERTPPTSEDFYQNPITALGFQTERWFQICSESVAGFWENEMGKTVNRINAIYSGNPLNDPWSTTSYGNTSAVLDLFGPDGLGYLPATPGEVDCSWYGTAQDVINGINDGAFILQHRDHGFEEGWGEPAFQNSHINSLNNTDLTFIWSVNCLTGKYNIGSECFAEKFHRHTSGGENSGALGLVAASEVSYSFVNDTYVWGAYDNQWPDFMPDYGATPESRDVLPAFGNAAGKYFLEQSAWPYNTNNKEVTYNLFHHFGDAFTTVYANMPQTLAVNHDAVLFAGVTTFDVDANEGAFIALTVNGEIIGTATATGAPVSITIPGQIPPDQVVVTITKQDYYRYSATVEVIPQDGPFVVRESYTINDASGNNNGMMDYGESNLLSLSVENVGIEAATGVEVTISTDDEYVTITDDTEAYGDIEANATALVEDGFAYDVANDLPDGHSVSFEVSATDGTDVWVSYFSITGYAPVLDFVGFSISDPTGNNNGKLDPGESADITIEIENGGSSEAFAIMGNLLETDPFLTVNTEDVDFGDLMAGNTSSGVFSVYAEETTPAGHMVGLEFEMAAELGIEGMGEFNVVIGQIPVIIIDMDGNGNSAQGMEDALGNMEIAYEVSSSFPPDLNLYSTIFLPLGIYSDNHVLSSGEGSNLADYLNAGGNLYMEGGDTWYYDNATAVHAMFGINGTSDGSGDLSTINGQSGTFTEDMSFSYTGDNNWIDHLEATGTGEVIFMNQSPSYGTAISNDGGDYKTIGASHEFGGLSDGSSPSTKAELMAKYLEFFGMTGGTQVLTAVFTADETEVCAEESIAFSDLSLGSPTSWSWTFEGGSPETSSAQNPSVMYFIAGNFDVTLEVSDGIETVSVTMEDYITVNAAPEQAAMPEGEAEICTNYLTGPVDYTTTGTDEADSYIWKLTPDEAGTISGDGLTASVTFNENWIGTAMIKVKGVNDCGDGEFSESFEVLCDICESIDESMLRNSLSIFPNPTNGEFTVEFNMNIGTTQVEVVNLLNQVVYTNNVDVNTNTALKVDLSSFGDGLYFVRIKAKNSESIKKVVVR
jgi:PKD repeat protein